MSQHSRNVVISNRFDSYPVYQLTQLPRGLLNGV